MDTELLVDNLTEEGQKVVTELIVAGFDVSIAFWVKTSEDGLWSLYIGSKSVEPSKIGDAYRTVYACLSKIPNSVVGISDVKLIQTSDPISADAIAIRDRRGGRFPVRVQGTRLGSLSVEEAYIYPRVGGQMTSEEMLQMLLRIANRPGGANAKPSTIRLSSGVTVTAIITGFNLQMPGGLTIHTLDTASNTRTSIVGDDVINIEP